MKALTNDQRTFDWYKARLGMFTASQIHKLMIPSDLKANTFGETASKYISLIAGERKLKAGYWCNMTDEEKQDFIWTQYPSNTAMKWGTAHEGFARNAYEFATDNEVEETGSCIKEEREYVSASPDGIIKNSKGIIEIKCPQMETYVEYSSKIKDAQTLKTVKKEYYWQIMLQMYVTDAEYCHFVWYHPYLGMDFATIERNQADIDLLLKRIDEAEEIARERLNKINK